MASLGLAALGKGLMDQTGLVSELPQFESLGLAPWNDFVVGGHDIREGQLYDEAMRMHTVSRAVDADLVKQCKDELDRIQQNIRPGTIINVGQMITQLASDEVQRFEETPTEAIERIQGDLKAFIQQHQLDRLVVINIASTEPGVDTDPLPAEWSDLKKLLDQPDKCPLPASSLYAIATLELGHAYINFTPSLGSTPAAISQLAIERKTCHMGRDGKTGETLLKSVLAPMFAKRNFDVMSWVGHNIFGNLDGKVLDDPANKKAKVASKDRLLGKILGYDPQSHISIEYIESLGDWKTAWDHIHFKGFLGTPMVLQFTWQGCDSILAAPLVLDLIRFTERAARDGVVGLLTFLASFFKSPLGVEENEFAKQFDSLEAWARCVAKS